MNPSDPRDRIVRELRFLKAYAVLSSLALVVLSAGAFTTADARRLQVLDVERLNVLNPDGSLALAIAGRGMLPGPTFEGREYAQELSGGRTGASGMIFFNERGDEVGGLTFQGRLTGERYSASGTITFDQFQQDQVVGLQYSDNGRSRSAGVNVWDRSTEISLGRILELVDARRTSTGAALDSVQAEIRALAEQGLGTHRVFLGSQDRTAALLLRDTGGRPRIRLSVDSADVARLEFLDADGNVVEALPGGGAP